MIFINYSFLIAIALGVLCVVIGVINMRGNISTIHSYHRQRITEENILPFGRMVGLGTLIIGVSIILYGFSILAYELSKKGIFIIIGVAVMIVGIVIGIILSFYAMIKYNKGIF